MTNLPTQRSSLLLKLLILVTVLTVSLLLIAIFRFDIGAYRQEIATQLEKTLKKPVKLGTAELRFDNGLTIDFHDLEIGDDDSFRLSVPRLCTTLEPWGLLQGEVVIKRILIDSPTLKLKLPLILARSALNFERFGLKTLRVKEGSLVITPTESTQNEIRVDHLNLVLHGLGQGTVSQLVTTATIARQSQTSALKLSLKLTRQQPGQDWRQGSLRGNFSLSNLGHFIPVEQRPAWLSNPLDLSINIEGIPAKRVAINALLDDGKNGTPRFELSSDWQSFASIDQLTNLRLGRTQIPLRGQVELNHQGDEPQLSGQLSFSNIEILSLLNSFGLPTTEINGQIDQFSIKLDGPLHPSVATPFAPFHSARLRLSNLSYTHEQAQLENLRFSLTVSNTEINLSKGQGNINKLPFTFSGSGSPLTRKNFELTFNLHSDLNLEQLQQNFPSRFLNRQKIKGIAPLNVQVRGTTSNLVTHLELDLTKTELELGKLLNKKQGIPFRINIAGQRAANTLTLDQLKIELDQAKIMASGSLTSGQQGWLGTISFSPLKLEKLQSSSPTFKHFRINGRAQGELKLTPKDWQAQIKLTTAGAHFTPLIADLKQVRTILTIDRDGIDFGQAQALLGQSPISVTGTLTNWRGALIALHVTGKEVRAQDLIFTNQQMKLQKLDGKLLINGGGISFDPVHVTVENRTRVQVAGMIRDFHNPQTYLEIESEDADILDIIRLFSGPHKLLPKKHRTNDTSLKILARVKKGQLGSFSFEDATGTIIDRHNVFTLDPLRFKLGKGYSLGRVEIDRDRNNLLKISGHAQNCDADRVYEMLFEKKGIFRGTLSGDFYLEGEKIGERFWKTAQGGGHLQIKDGAMRELKGFAQIFSLLNVSQLFKFKLPDMDKEGLPLSLLEGSGRMTNGILYFDDIKITSPAINISAVGQIDTLNKTIDSTLGIKPLRTVDIILSNVPLFGWVLTGKEEALITALFTLKGPIENPKVAAAPASSVANTALGIIGRTLGLPFRIIQKTGEFLTTPLHPEKIHPKQIPTEQTD